ncbi:MAG: ABC transporter permease [Sphingobacteriaceae bacterium]|nr:ABC transporter permease [Cytophagaceae bacterium]
MFKHLFRLMWNKKRGHVLLIVEILAAFLVLFGVTSLIIYNFRNYREPIGFDYENVWVLQFDSRDQPDSSASETMRLLKSRALAYPEVASASLFSGNSPFSMSTSNGSMSRGKSNVQSNQFTTDRDLVRALNVAVVEGRWFDPSDEVPDARTLVINQPMKKALFSDENAVGQYLAFGDFNPKEAQKKYRVVGVVGNFKGGGEYQKNEPGVFQLPPRTHWLRTLLLKVKPGTDANFEARLTRDFAAITKDWNLDVSYMEKQRRNAHNLTLVPVIIFLIVSGFLLINVALGLFGVLNLSIAQRRSEIGVRRAMGATAGAITRQFVGEIWVLATFGLLIGLLFAVQFPLLNVFDLEACVYLTAIGVSVMVIYTIVTLCALYPSRQAARVQPSVALHEE